ncbi:MAG: 2-oxoglutarate dehydrogenase subunit E1 [Gemmataceae bacterium]|nr:MAG: 2-oxoglutarate dehydrogenase subunit E1 [Gemmataceae bacterium]
MYSENGPLLEELYRRWRDNPSSVDSSWAAFFSGMEFASRGGEERRAVSGSDELRRQTGVERLIHWYRQAGHLQAHIDPLSAGPPPPSPLLDLANFGLTEADLDQTVDASSVWGLGGLVRLRQLLEHLQASYCGSVGVEFMHIDSLDIRNWIAQRLETQRGQWRLGLRQRYRILITLLQAETFERFLHTKYVGQKRFSLEGGETLIPILDALIEKGPELGVREYVLGMAHRGRLNVLANILNKPLAEIFFEFEDNYLPQSTIDGDGDVKYHLGFSADVETSAGQKVHISLTPNPSHLEIVDPVVQGRVRCKQRLHQDRERKRGIPILIHGDAAFAGQGIVMETFNLMNLAGYRTGGTLHIVVNNQIGFTTNPRDARSTQYCTDIAKFVQVPIFHVNAEDPEACVAVAHLALEFRQQFQRDVVIDLVCYRKWGHNEGDNPSFTQPLQCRIIEQKRPISQLYAQRLSELSAEPAQESLSAEVSAALDAEFQDRLAEALRHADVAVAEYRRKLESTLNQVRGQVALGQSLRRGMEGFGGRWRGLQRQYTHAVVETGAAGLHLDTVADAFVHLPEGFTVHPQLIKLLQSRHEAIRLRKTVDWATAESLAFGTLLLEGIPVRLSGQDSRRGTFSQRHAVLVDYHTGAEYYPLAHLSPQQAAFEVYDSSLSEAAILGFEYGYSLDDPYALVLWEAQFGDFANGAQVIIDQFLVSGESKWNRSSGLVLLLPHGYEGQGPEHSSARLERFLQMCAEDNIQVCYPTTPAQYFHLLRRQVKRPFRKPLVVMTPKSLLRLPQAQSPVSELEAGHFHEVLDDPSANPEVVTRVLLCSGKIYYELLRHREHLQTVSVALVRLEQLYPWPGEQLGAVLGRYRRCREWLWVQEEPQNMGAWSFVEPRLRAMGFPVEYVGRDAGASPATGSFHVHQREQQLLVEGAFATTPPGPIGPGSVGWVASDLPSVNGPVGAESPLALVPERSHSPSSQPIIIADEGSTS